MKNILVGIFLGLVLLSTTSHAGRYVICDLDGNCRVILTPGPGPDNGGVIIDTGDL